MTKVLEPMINELHQEAAITRRVLERIPADKLSWKPHPKSMSLGQLAMHLAMTPGNLSAMAKLEEFDASNANFNPPSPSSKEEILQTHDSGVKAAAENLAGISDSYALANWRLLSKGKELLNIPRVGVVRSFILNHSYHHRGQLSVYLRMLEVPVPVIYGRSADEDPFA